MQNWSGGVLTADQVSAVLVTRGDVDLSPIIETLPYDEIVIWNNAERPYNAGAFGRYLAIAEAKHDVIYFQDDDCIVLCHDALMEAYEDGKIVANMDRANGEFMDSKCGVLLGWGSLFRRDLPQAAFDKWYRFYDQRLEDVETYGAEWVFPALTPKKWIDGGYEHLPQYDAPNRSWKQEDFAERRDLFLQRASIVRRKTS